MSSLKAKAINSVFWSGIERFSVQGIQFIISLIIARILLPSDYGLIAMLGIFLAIAQSFVDSGFGSALIQKQNRTQADYSTVFYFNIGTALLAYILLWLASPAIATFYNEPQLDLITKIVGINVILNSFVIVQQAQLTIKLNFRLQALISLIAAIISGIIGIIMACTNYGVWALITQSLLNSGIKTVLLWLWTHWSPSWCFSQTSFRELFGFGSKLLLSGLLHTVYTNLYTLIIGKRYSVTDLGYYSRAYAFPNVVSGNLVNIITRAIYPIQCSIQNDNERLKASFLTYIRMSCYIIFPLMVGMIVLAKPLVLVLLTEKWLFSAELLQILCLAYMWEIIMRINYNLLSVKGRTDYTLKSEIYKKGVAFIILLVTFPFGLKILCWGLVLYSWADMFIITRYTRKLINVGLWTEIRVITPVLLLTTGMGFIVYLSTLLFESSLLQLTAGTLCGALFYIGISHLLHFEDLKIIRNFIKQKS